MWGPQTVVREGAGDYDELVIRTYGRIGVPDDLDGACKTGVDASCGFGVAPLKGAIGFEWQLAREEGQERDGIASAINGPRRGDESDWIRAVVGPAGLFGLDSRKAVEQGYQECEREQHDRKFTAGVGTNE